MSDSSRDPTLFPSTMAYRGPAPQPAAAALKQLAQYRIVRQLGRGGMGVVYQAEDTQLHRMAALKVMRADYAADPEALARFLLEAQAAARLKHDHIVTIYQVGQENGLPFLAMEFLSGKSLEDWLRPDRRATIVEALLISKQIARGLSAAHAAGLVHRDIKPANLWLEAPRGRLKILDFGLARHTAGEHPALTQDGSILGTPAFMAPEQARGDVVDQRCDLFSLGCVMYRILTGRLPFQGTTTYAVLSAIAAETPPSPKSIRDDLPQRLSDLVDKLLAKKPGDRPASAQAVLDELAAIEKEVKQPASPPSLLNQSAVPVAILPEIATPVETISSPRPTVRMAKPARRKENSQLVLYLAIGGAAIVGVLGLMAILLNQPGNQETAQAKPYKRPAVSPSSTESPNKAAPVVRPEPVSLPEVKPVLPPNPQTSPITPAVESTRPSPSIPPVESKPPDNEPMKPGPEAPALAVQSVSPLQPVSELNASENDIAPWVSPDGLDIYFTRETLRDGNQTWHATRASVDVPFGTPRVVNGLRHATLSSDGLVMVGVQKDGQTDKLFETRRAGPTDEFPPPQMIESLKDQPSVKAPFLATARYLIFQRRDDLGDYAGKPSPAAKYSTEFVFCRRAALRDAWSRPVRLPMTDDPLYSDALTWPALSDDGLTLFFCNGGARFPQVMFATRTSQQKSFVNPQHVMVDGKPLLGRSPRYVAATNELYVSRDIGTAGGKEDFDLWRLRDFVPEASEGAPKPGKKQAWPKDAQPFAGHHYKFFPQQLTWHEAKKRCEAAGGYLAVIDSAAENAFVAGLISKEKWVDTWIGITDEAKEGTWVTVLGEPVKYTNWFTGQPNNKLGGEHYGVMSGVVLTKESFNWRWSDQPDQALPTPHHPGYVCEWEPADDDEAAEKGFVSLFDGKSLAGWEGEKSGYEVQGGLLVGKGDRANLFTQKQYSDFEFRFEFRLAAAANSGIMIRSPRVSGAESPIPVNEIQIYDESSPAKIQAWQRHGSLYGMLPAESGHLKPVGQWNSQSIVCRGDQLKVILNGATILEAEWSKLAAQQSPDGRPHNGLRNKQGYLGLMGNTNRVEFRNLRIKELK